MKAYLSLGSNKGDRSGNISGALSAISSLPDTVIEAVSDIIVTPAQGQWETEYGGTPATSGGEFLNCCCRIETLLTPEMLLDALQEIERELGRPAHSPVFDCNGARIYSDRTIDIDILLFGGLEISTDRLQIPHPRMRERDFVMTPLRQILLP